MKLKTLKSSLQADPASRLQLLTTRPHAVERKRGSAGVKDREKIRQRDCGICQECRRQGMGRPGSEVDHIIPLWEEGTDDESNKELLCLPCHLAKGRVEAARRAAAR